MSVAVGLSRLTWFRGFVSCCCLWLLSFSIVLCLTACGKDFLRRTFAIVVVVFCYLVVDVVDEIADLVCELLKLLL